MSLHISQEALWANLKTHIPAERSFVDEVANVLDISYDAAYRRINLKSQLSLDEAVTLARHYKISLNRLFEVGQQNTLLVEKSPPITSLEGLEQYFLVSMKSIEPLINAKGVEIIYSAKDIPIFFTLTNTYITKYKFYVWLKFLDEDGSMAKMSFEEFLPTIPASLIETTMQLAETYNYLDITEFWNDNTINGTLQQVYYYFESGHLSKTLAEHLCKDLHEIIDRVEQQTIQQAIINSKNNARYLLYKSDLLTMSNTVMFRTPKQSLFFTPFTVLTYLKVVNPATCGEMLKFFNKQKSNSKLLASAGEKDRGIFFNKMRQKVDLLLANIQADRDLNLF
ncbi:hypothetical protein [Gilvibacter sp.]|uniref:hypothetical protein n=1 Tax=Gilvibacter sp. TaxID=2729997 RepID=UPI003F49BBFD